MVDTDVLIIILMNVLVFSIGAAAAAHKAYDVYQARLKSATTKKRVKNAMDESLRQARVQELENELFELREKPVKKVKRAPQSVYIY